MKWQKAERNSKKRQEPARNGKNQQETARNGKKNKRQETARNSKQRQATARNSKQRQETYLLPSSRRAWIRSRCSWTWERGQNPVRASHIGWHQLTTEIQLCRTVGASCVPRLSLWRNQEEIDLTMITNTQESLDKDDDHTITKTLADTPPLKVLMMITNSRWSGHYYTITMALAEITLRKVLTKMTTVPMVLKTTTENPMALTMITKRWKVLAMVKMIPLALSKITSNTRQWGGTPGSHSRQIWAPWSLLHGRWAPWNWRRGAPRPRPLWRWAPQPQQRWSAQSETCTINRKNSNPPGVFEFPKLNLLTNSNWWKKCFVGPFGNIKSIIYHFLRGWI